MANTVYGQINENGGIEINSGPITSAERTSKGRYKVQLAGGTFSKTPVVVATVLPTEQECGSSTNRTISVADASTTEICFGVRVSSDGDDSSDRPFNFMAMG